MSCPAASYLYVVSGGEPPTAGCFIVVTRCRASYANVVTLRSASYAVARSPCVSYVYSAKGCVACIVR